MSPTNKFKKGFSAKQELPRPNEISDEEWNLPAGFKADGSIATLKEVLTPQISTMNLFNLGSGQRKNLVVERIKQKKDYPQISFLGMPGIDKEAAISEVQKQSQIGRLIEESEQNAIQLIIDRASLNKSKGNG